MMLLKRIWTDEDEDPEVKTLYQYVVDLRDRVEETYKMAKEELAKVQVRNQKYYNKRTRNRKLQVGDSVLQRAEQVNLGLERAIQSCWNCGRL